MKPFSIGIDLGGTIIKMGLVRENKIFTEACMQAHSGTGLAPSLPLLAAQINKMLQQHGIEKEQVAGVGLAFPGLVDSRNAKVLSTNQKYDDAAALDLRQWATENWHTHFFMDNDARMAAVGEWKFGAGQGCNDLVTMTLGTGIGSSAIIEGRLLRGRHFQAGVLGGHLTLNYLGNRCTCGNIGCAEAEAATWNIAKKIEKAHLFGQSILAHEPTLDFAALFRAAALSDGLALQMRDECLQIWSAAVINLVHAYDPEVVVLSGGIMASADQILPYIQNRVASHAWCPWGQVQVRASRLQHHAAILGVAYCL